MNNLSNNKDTKLGVAKYDLDNVYQKVNQNDVVRALNLSLGSRKGPLAS